jgi:hypothetical protein
MTARIVTKRQSRLDPEYQVRHGQEILATFTTRPAAEAYLALIKRGSR